MSLFLQQSLRSGEFQILCYFVWPDPMDVGGWSGKEVAKRKFYWKVLWVLELVSVDQSDIAMHLLDTYHEGLYVSALSKSPCHLPGGLATCTCVVI